MVGSAAILVVVTMPGSSGLAVTVGDPVPLTADGLATRPDAATLSAMQRDLNLSADGAVQLLGREQAAHRIDERVRKLAGPGYAGAWLEDNAAVLKVGVTRPSLIPMVRAAGATPVLVRHSLSELEAASQRLHSIPFPSQSLTGWSVDVVTNRVVIGHLPHGRAAGQRFAAAGHIDAAMVRYESRKQHSTGTAGEIFAGRRFEFQSGGTRSCTLGFAVQRVNELFGNFGFVSAGHCLPPGGFVNMQGGAPLGTTVGTTFVAPPGAPDQGWLEVTDFGATTTAPKVFTYKDPFFVDILGSKPAMRGESVCRVGSVSSPAAATFALGCGRIIDNLTAEFIDFGDSGALSRVVGGLAKLNVCATPGDSGGPVFTPMGQAQGITVGTPKDDNGNLMSCTTNPQAPFMFFQPINPILNEYGLKLFRPPAPLKISSLNCDRELTGPGWVCQATWTGGVDLATASWHVNVPRLPPYVITDSENHVTEAHFACFFDEAEPDYPVRVIIRDAVGAQVSGYSHVCQW
jgi:streptogrisin C